MSATPEPASSNGQLLSVEAAVDAVRTAPAPAPLEAPVPPRLPAMVTARLAELAALMTGAEQAAQAAVEVHQRRRETYLAEFNLAVLTLGLPAGRNWRLNFTNGELNEVAAPPPSPLLAEPPIAG